MINLYHIDCMEFMADKPDKFYDLAIVGPPYGIGNWIQISGNINPNHKKVEWNEKENRPTPEYWKELRRVSKNRIIWGANYYPECFENYNGAIIWDKGVARESHFSVCEIASQSFTKRVDCIRINWQAIQKKIGDLIHPCSKPVQLYKWLLMNYAKPGDKILDTHGGSGSICIACHDLGFDLDWCELDADYFEAAKKRFEIHKAQLKLF